MKKERTEDRNKQVEENKEKPFPLLVRAKSTRKSASTQVQPEDIVTFYRELRDIMGQSMSFESKYSSLLDQNSCFNKSI